MAALTNAEATQLQTIIDLRLTDVLTPSQLTLAKNKETLKMLWSESAGDGSTDQLSKLETWVKTEPLAMKYLTTPGTLHDEFIKIIDGTVSFTTAANALPDTYINLHAESTANEAKLDGLIALRSYAVDSTFRDDGANLGAGSAGTVLADATVMALHGTWGATKYKNILNLGVLKSIENESNALYDTLGEIDALYDAWAGTVNVDKFFQGVKKIYDGGVTTIEFSDVMAYASNQTNFDKYTSDAAIKLMATTGGSWSAVTGLSGAAYTALTSPSALKAIDSGGATFTLLNGVYTADTTKYDALLANDSLSLMTKGYAGIDYSGLSTGYGTTYTTAAHAKYAKCVDTEYHQLYKNGASYANIAAAYDAGKLSCFTKQVVAVMDDNLTDFNTNFAALVGMTSAGDFAGLETLGNGTICA